MKLRIIRSKFIEGLKTVQNIVGGKGSLAVLQNVLLEASGKELKMTTTDLDISISTVCECEVLEAGNTTLPVKFLFNAISKVVEGDVELYVDAKDRATIQAGKAKYNIAGLPYTDFPKLPNDEQSCEYKILQATFKEMLRKVYYAASQDDTRRTLKGVLVSFKDGNVTMVATDGRRLALTKNELEFPKSAEKDIVLPSKAVAELQRSLNGEGEAIMQVNKTQLCFKFENTTIYSKLMDEVYPNYNQVIPKETIHEIAVDRQLLLDALERVNVMTMDEAHSTKLIFSEGKLTVTSAASDIGDAKDEVEIKYSGEEKIEIIFNPNYIMDCLKAIDEDEITVNLNDGHSPAIIKCKSPFLYVLMPLRIS